MTFPFAAVLSLAAGLYGAFRAKKESNAQRARDREIAIEEKKAVAKRKAELRAEQYLTMSVGVQKRAPKLSNI